MDDARTSDSSGGQWYRAVYERVKAEPDDELIDRIWHMPCFANTEQIRAVIAAYRADVLRGK